MAKVKKVKWSVGSDEPDDLQDFKDNTQIIKENGGLPNKGVYRLVVRKVWNKPNRNGDDRVSVMQVIDEPKGSKNASYNGYMVAMDGFNITEQGKPFLKRWLKGLGLTWDDFYNNTKEQEDTGDRTEIIQIGRIKFGSAANKDVHVNALLKEFPADDYNDDDHMGVVRYIPADDDSSSEGDSSADEEAAVDMSGDDDSKGDVLTSESLASMKPKALVALAQENGIKQKKIDKAGKDRKALTDLLVKELNLPPF